MKKILKNMVLFCFVGHVSNVYSYGEGNVGSYQSSSMQTTNDFKTRFAPLPSSKHISQTTQVQEYEDDNSNNEIDALRALLFTLWVLR